MILPPCRRSCDRGGRIRTRADRIQPPLATTATFSFIGGIQHLGAVGSAIGTPNATAAEVHKPECCCIEETLLRVCTSEFGTPTTEPSLHSPMAPALACVRAQKTSPPPSCGLSFHCHRMPQRVRFASAAYRKNGHAHAAPSASFCKRKGSMRASRLRIKAWFDIDLRGTARRARISSTFPHARQQPSAATRRSRMHVIDATYARLRRQQRRCGSRHCDQATLPAKSPRRLLRGRRPAFSKGASA